MSVRERMKGEGHRTKEEEKKTEWGRKKKKKKREEKVKIGEDRRKKTQQ